MRPPILRLAAVAALFVPAGAPAQDSGSTLQDLVAEAERENPGLRAAESRVEAARARVPQAGALPDPMLGVGVMNVPVSDPSFADDMMTMINLRVSERFPFPGKRGLRERRAETEAEAARWEAERVRRKIVAEVKEAYYRLYFIDRALEVTRRNDELLASFADLTSTTYGVGFGTQPDILRAQVERTRLQDQLVELREGRNAAAARLNAVLARPSDAPAPETEIPDVVRMAAADTARAAGGPSFTSEALGGFVGRTATDGGREAFDVRELQRLARQHSPSIRVHEHRVSAQKTGLSLARKSKLPDFSVSVGYSRRPAFGDLVDFMISVPLPVFAGRKQNQGVREHEAALDGRRSALDAAVDELDDEIASLVAELEGARDRLVLLEEGTLPQAEASLAAATASYRVGDVDFLTLLDAQVTLYRQELDEHRLLSDFATNLARLERAVGTEVLR